MTSEQAKALFANVAQESPERWPAAVQTLVVGCFQQLEQYEANFRRLLEGTHALSLEIKALRERLGGSAPQATPEAEVEAAAPVMGGMPIAPEPTPTVGISGEPLTPEQMELERTMNEAVAAEQAEKAGARPAPRAQGGRPRPMAQPAQQAGKLRPVPKAPNAPVNGQDPAAAQAALEAQMDAGIAAMEKP